MKRPISILISCILLLALSAGSFFYYAYVCVSEISAKSEAQAHISQNDLKALATIKMPSAQFSKKNREIWHNGHLYDIASYRIAQDTAFITVFHDEKEEDLIDIVKAFFGSNNDYVVSGNERHLSPKHTYPLNEVKCLCSVTTIPYQATGETSVPNGNRNEALSVSICNVDGPPPRS